MIRSLLASGVLAGGGLFTPVAHADWACTVMLCLGDPRGPTAEPACRPPIQKLWRELAKGRSMPTCRGEDGVAMSLRSNVKWYEDCPSGTVPAPGENALVAQGTLMSGGQLQINGYPRQSAGSWHMPMAYDGLPRACVGGASYSSWVPGVSDQTGQEVRIYDTVIWIEQEENPWSLELYHGGRYITTYRPQ